jgi:hypothetical protein
LSILINTASNESFCECKQQDEFIGYLLGILQAFVGFTDIANGFRLILNPNGIPDFSIELLKNSPFTNYLIPGLVLLNVIGFGNVMADTVFFYS